MPFLFNCEKSNMIYIFLQCFKWRLYPTSMSFITCFHNHRTQAKIALNQRQMPKNLFQCIVMSKTLFDNDISLLLFLILIVDMYDYLAFVYLCLFAMPNSIWII